MESALLYFINSFFINLDKGEWRLVDDALADTLFVDYESLNGQHPSNQSNKEIISFWKSFLPGFEVNHHQLSNFLCEKIDDAYNVFMYAIVYHYLFIGKGQSLVMVVGSYNMEVKIHVDSFKITKIKFNFQFRDGNHKLEEIAIKNVKDLNSNEPI